MHKDSQMKMKDDMSLTFYSVIINKYIVDTVTQYQANLNTFFIDMEANIIRVHASFFEEQNIKMARSVQVGDIVQFSSTLFSLEGPSFIGLYEPKIQLIPTHKTTREWREHINCFICADGFENEIYTRIDIHEEELIESYEFEQILLPEQDI